MPGSGPHLLLALDVEGQLPLPILLCPNQDQAMADPVLVREPLRTPIPREVGLHELQLEFRAVSPMPTHPHCDLRADCLKGQSRPPDLSTSKGSLQKVCNFHPPLTASVDDIATAELVRGIRTTIAAID